MTDRRTDGPTDGRTDTPSYRDARTHLKRMDKLENFLSMKGGARTASLMSTKKAYLEGDKAGLVLNKEVIA